MKRIRTGDWDLDRVNDRRQRVDWSEEGVVWLAAQVAVLATLVGLLLLVLAALGE